MTLTAGEAFFSVAGNPARPFLVVVGDKQVRVLGTKFEVRRDEADLRVSVVEGTVEVTQGPAPQVPLQSEAARSDERVLVAGQQLNATVAGAIEVPRPSPKAEPAAWRHGRLVYVDSTLREVVADANRYSRESIAIEGEPLAELRVSVTYPSGKVDEMLAALARSMSLNIEHRGPNDIVLTAKRPPG